MKRNNSSENNDELRPEYDLSQLRSRGRGKYAERYRAGTKVVIDPEVAEEFATDEAANETQHHSDF